MKINNANVIKTGTMRPLICPPPPPRFHRLSFSLCAVALAVSLSGVAVAQTAGTVTISATGNNGDRDPATPGLQVDEGDTLTITVTANGLSAGEVFPEVVENWGNDIVGNILNRIRFSEGGSLDSVHLVRDDNEVEGDETFTVTLLSNIVIAGAVPSTWTVGTPSSVTITIRANDGSVAMLGGADADAPGGGTINVPVEFSSSPARTADSTVAFAITGTAAATDYTVTTGGGITFDAAAATGTIEIAQADTSGAIPIRIASGATAGRTLIVTLTGHTGGGVSSVVSSAPRTYTLTESTPAPVAGVTLSATTLAVGEGDNGAYSVALTSEPGGAVVITPSVLPGGHDLTLTRGGVALLPSGALTFTAANWNSAQTVSVAAGEDDDATDDTATIRHVVSGYGSVTAGAVVVTVSDDDAADSAPAFDAADAPEDRTYTVDAAITDLVLPEASGGNGALSYALDVSAVAGLVFDANTRTLSGTPSVVAGAVALTYIVTDSDGNTDAGDSDALTFSVTVAPVVITPAVMVSPTTLAVDEGGSGTYSIVLTTEPVGGNVTVTPSSDTDAVTVTPAGGLVFTTGNWDTVQTVTVTGTARALIRHRVDGTGNYTGVTAASVRVLFGNAEEVDATNAVILPEVARVMVGNHVSAITHRISQARTATGGAGAGLRANLGGHSTLEELAATHAQTMVDGGLDTKTLLGGADFAMPLNADGVGGLGGANLALWGSGDYRNIGGDSNNVDWDGSLFSAHLGVDVALQPGLLAGVMLAWSEADLEYTNRNTATAAAATGDYELDMTSLHPYVGWRALDGRLDLWTTVGYGSGDLKITEANTNPTTADATLQTLGAGGSARLLASRDTELRVKGEVQATRLEVEQAADDAFNEMEVNATQTRLALEATRTVTTRSGAQVSPSLELGMRYDGGDGATGNGVEIGGGFRFQSAARGLTLETRARALLAHSGETEDIGISATLKLTPGADGQGLSLSLAPAYGNTGGGGAEEVWQGGLSADIDPQASLNARVGYGLPAAAFMLTPYGEMALGEDVQNYRLGLSWGVGALFDLNLVGEREEKDGVGAEHAIWFEGRVRF